MNSTHSIFNKRIAALGLLGFAAACGDPTAGEPPLVEILRPTEGEVFSVGRSIPLDCDVQTADEEAVITIDWSAIPVGDAAIFLSDKASDATTSLSPGVHQIVCTASDGDFENNDIVTITVTNDAPIVSIVNPDPEGDLRFFASQAVAYTGSVVDVDGNAEVADLQWEVISTSGGPVLHSGEGRNGAIPEGTLEPGEYQLMAYVTDELGEVGSSWVIFQVLPDPVNLPPWIEAAEIVDFETEPYETHPTLFYIEQCLVDIDHDGYHDGGDRCRRLHFTVYADDDNDALEDLTYHWTVTKDGVEVETRDTRDAPFFDLLPGNYRLEVVVRDTMGAQSAAHVFDFIVTDLI